MEVEIETEAWVGEGDEDREEVEREVGSWVMVEVGRVIEEEGVVVESDIGA